MTKQAAKRTRRGLSAAAGAVMLTLAAGMPVGAAVAVDHTVTVAGPTPSGTVDVAGQEIPITGAKDLSVRIQATQALADPVTVGKTGKLDCTLFDQAVRLDLDAGASGAVTVEYTTIDGVTGDPTVNEPDSITFGPTPAASQEIVKICLR